MTIDYIIICNAKILIPNRFKVDIGSTLMALSL